MREVRIPKDAAPPTEWLKEAEKLTTELRDAATEKERMAVIDANDGFWRKEIIRNWLTKIFHNKCWYTEAKESVSSYHVDHYRPKGRVTDLQNNQSGGYWWLAFDWTNYRICGQLINVKKSDVFPLCEPPQASFDDAHSLEKEAPLLIDPVSGDTRLISYELDDEEECLAVPAAGIDIDDELRASQTIEILGLNRLTRLKENRAAAWGKALRYLADYEATSGNPQALKKVLRMKAIGDLRDLVRYEEEFSSIAEACIRKNAPIAVQAQVFDQLASRTKDARPLV